jgi:uncharacterized membrane protein YjgN (DUF898 family)
MMIVECPSCSFKGKAYPQHILYEADRTRRIRCPECSQFFSEKNVSSAPVTGVRPSAPSHPEPATVAKATPEAEADLKPQPLQTEAVEAPRSPAASIPARGDGEETSLYRAPTFHGTGGSLFGIYIVNMLLSTVTMGIYYFWGKARVRKYLYSQTEFDGDRFSYHGTGKELFLGYLKAMLVLAGVWGTMVLSQRYFPPGQILAVIVFIGLVPFALYGSMRFSMSRTSWRGIHFSFRGDLKELIKVYLLGSLLSIVTFGFYTPFFRTNLRSYWMNNIHIGDKRFEYDGHGRDLLTAYVVSSLLLIPTLGLSFLWFLAKEQRYNWNHTRLAGGQFVSDITAGGLIGLKIVNLLLIVFSLGLAYPWVKTRNAAFLATHLAVEGPMDTAHIHRSAQPAATAMGEGLGEILDVGMSIG